jgi:hypothetical protein
MGEVSIQIHLYECGHIVEKPCNELECPICKEINFYKQAATKLWDMLDDIDTAEDIAKDDDATFRKLVRHTYMRRLEVAESKDGYSLTFKR